MKKLLLLLLPCLLMSCQKEFSSLSPEISEDHFEVKTSNKSQLIYEISELPTELGVLVKAEENQKGAFVRAEIFHFESAELIKTVFSKNQHENEVFFSRVSNTELELPLTKTSEQEYSMIRIECVSNENEVKTPCPGKVDLALGQVTCDCPTETNAMMVSTVGGM